MSFDQDLAGEVDAPDPVAEHYRRVVRAITGLPELAMRRARLDEGIRSLDADVAVWFMDQLVRGALWGREAEMDAMLTCAAWLVSLREQDEYDTLQEFYLAAHESERKAVLFLLRDSPAHRAMGENAKLPEVRMPVGREVTLGERRQLAAGPDRRFLERLIYESSPLVIEKVLANPHIRLQDVLIIAARRPTTPELLREVMKSDQWFREMRVREALVQNPYIPTGFALKMMPTLHVDVLRKLRFATDLHAMIQEFASLLVELREQRTAPWGY